MDLNFLLMVIFIRMKSYTYHFRYHIHSQMQSFYLTLKVMLEFGVMSQMEILFHIFLSIRLIQTYQLNTENRSLI